MPVHDAFLDLDLRYKDRHGQPLLRMTFDWNQNDINMAKYVTDRAVKIMQETGGQHLVVDKAAIARGEYVMRLSDCAACHNPNFAGGYKIDTPFGVLETSNITPDRETGIGKMTERDFFNSVRQGRGDHGLLYPAMPYTACP